MTRQNPAMPRRQRGVVLIFTLIVLLVLTIGGVALVRSMSTSMFSAGNLAFRRDLVNQGEQAVANVLAAFSAGGALSTSAVTVANVSAWNYSASMLPTNSQGVPNVLLSNDTVFNATGFSSSTNDITGAVNGGISANSGVTIRYVVDRLCAAAGAATGTTCVQSAADPTGGTANHTPGLPVPTATVYRLTVRVSGVRSTQVFLQTTFTRAD